MMRKLTQKLRGFKRDENGQMVIEFALLIPLIFTMFMTSVELGIYQIRQMFLDRGLDMTVRQIRLNTGTPYSHDDLKTMICNFSGFLDDCDTQLALEMETVDMRAFSGLSGGAECGNVPLPIVPPPGTLKYGVSHQTMVMRACYVFDPVFDSSGLGYQFEKSGSNARMVSVSAFVQEP
jgi:Flp pilus assembly pilin Flp